MHKQHGWGLVCILILATSIAFAGCTGRAASPALQQVPGGDPERGKEAIRRYGCGSCHVVPGVAGANAWVGPPLTAWSARHYISGSLPNTPENLIVWLRQPQSVEPGTAMPNLNVTDQDARDMSAYLYLLEE